jgi:hypothetical protein
MDSAFEKGLDALKGNLNAILVTEFVGNSFAGFLGHSPFVYLIEMSHSGDR